MHLKSAVPAWITVSLWLLCQGRGQCEEGGDQAGTKLELFWSEARSESGYKRKKIVKKILIF